MRPFKGFDILVFQIHTIYLDQNNLNLSLRISIFWQCIGKRICDIFFGDARHFLAPYYKSPLLIESENDNLLHILLLFLSKMLILRLQIIPKLFRSR